MPDKRNRPSGSPPAMPPSRNLGVGNASCGVHADPLALIVSAGARKEKLRQREFAPGPPRSKPLAYVELRAASAFSFLDGASLPEDLVEEAARREIPAVALVDANGVYGAPRFYKAAKAAGVRAIVGSAVRLGAVGAALGP
ncbi:MAG TPA: PHP domain-containing protein, partial [Thermoanaerobaculia bacterium]|nr:PHP domain-containing protein [Thermoanaerobaculia bacterium]